MTASKFYVTTPIYYVNDKPHIGHAYTTILADVLSRYHRLMGIPTHFLTGTDEHGQKVQTAAAKHNVTPLEHCDATVVHFQELWKRLGITNDDFIRTTQERHKTVVSKILQDLYDRGLIYRSSYKGWYCVGDERFFTEKDLKDGACPECGRKVEEIEETCYNFRMGDYQEQLIKYIEEHPKFIQPDHYRNETLGFLRKGKLEDLCISRPKKRLSWGIELPFDKDYVTYVWFDALVNYISAIGYLSDEVEFKKWWPVNYHLIGKDILTTHSVYWPTMLMAMGLELPQTIFAHGWWLTGNKKMGKSFGNAINPMDMIDKYGVDAFRYFLIAAMVPGIDASFTEELLATRYNAELVNDLGNFVSRALTMVERFNGGFVPDIPEGEDPESQRLRDVCARAVDAVPKYIDDMKLDSALAETMAVVRDANKYWTEQKPWELAKAEDAKEKLALVIRNSLECLRIVSGLLYPVMPEKTTQIRKCLGIKDEAIIPDYSNLKEWFKLEAGSKTTALTSHLFPRIIYVPPKESADVPDVEAKAPSKKAKKAEKVYEPVSIEEVGKVQLKTAEVIAAEPVPDADKLLRLQIRLGDEERQIVSGIAQWYKPEDLIGKTIVVIANLKPAEIRGVESKGMLLAAKAGKTLRLVTIDGELQSGATIG